MSFPNDPNTTYKSKKGRHYIVVSISKVKNSEKWINRFLTHKWKVLIRFLDNKKMGVIYYDNYAKVYKYEDYDENSEGF